MKTFLKTFLHNDDGAVTVDWVVLTALVCTLLAAGYGLMESSTEKLSGDTSNYMSNWEF